MKYSIILFYKYVTIDDTKLFLEREKAVCAALCLTGRMIIASEGVNATLEGTAEDIARYRAHLARDKRFKNVDIKETEGKGSLFPRLSIKVRSEIVSSYLPAAVDPRKQTGVHLPPHELKKWFAEGKDFEIIDMRNDFEYAVGHFKGSHASGMDAFRDLPKVAENFEPLKEKTVVTVCTGGVRCEKASAYLQSIGFKNVYQLEGGMHRYMEAYPGEDFDGALYTFDGRVTMDFGGERTIVGKCTHCGLPSEAFADCVEETCGKHFIACDACRNADGKVGCKEHVGVAV